LLYQLSYGPKAGLGLRVLGPGVKHQLRFFAPIAEGITFPYISGMNNESDTHQNASDFRFLKMHGLGNDFVVVDARNGGDPITPALAKALGDRHRGVGFDQLAVMKPGSGPGGLSITFWNSDGSKAGACGNATRCIARLIMDETGLKKLNLQTERGELQAEDAGNGLVRVNMGHPQTTWNTIPLTHDIDPDHLDIDGNPGAAGMGNPHCVFVVPDAEAVDLEHLGPEFEHHPLFPERTNVEFVQVIDRNTLRMRVWERGGMVTLACGSGACAAAVVTARRGLTDHNVTIHLDGGSLEIDWRDDGVWMTGPTALVFEGTLSAEFIGATS
jgi:diaminopimelate epimerase